MGRPSKQCRRHRFPPQIIGHALWLYHRFSLSVRDVEDLLAQQRFLRKLIKGQGGEPNRLVTDKLRSYPPAHRDVMPAVPHETHPYADNRAEVSPQPTRQRERQMRRFKSPSQAQRFLSLHGLVQNLFRFGRHLLRAANARMFRDRAFSDWAVVTCVR